MDTQAARNSRSHGAAAGLKERHLQICGFGPDVPPWCTPLPPPAHSTTNHTRGTARSALERHVGAGKETLHHSDGLGRVSPHGRVLTRPIMWYHSYVQPAANQQRMNGDALFVGAFTWRWALFHFTIISISSSTGRAPQIVSRWRVESPRLQFPLFGAAHFQVREWRYSLWGMWVRHTQGRVVCWDTQIKWDLPLMRQWGMVEMLQSSRFLRGKDSCGI